MACHPRDRSSCQPHSALLSKPSACACCCPPPQQYPIQSDPPRQSMLVVLGTYPKNLHQAACVRKTVVPWFCTCLQKCPCRQERNHLAKCAWPWVSKSGMLEFPICRPRRFDHKLSRANTAATFSPDSQSSKARRHLHVPRRHRNLSRLCDGR